MNLKRSFAPIGAVIAIVVVVLGFSSVYTIQEGHVGILKTWGKAVEAVSPGLHFKVPFVQSVESMEVRTRKYSLSLSAATTGRNEESDQVELQMPSKVKISANWNIPAHAALEIFKQYGGLEEYEQRILDPRVTRATKQIFAKHSIEHIVSERELVRAEIEAALSDALADKLATMSDINIEDVDWSPKIRKAIEDKQTAKLNYEAEQYNLEKQNLESRRAVNTAQSESEGLTLNSQARAEAIRREGEAEAYSMEAKAKVLRDSPELIQLIWAEQWDGVLPKVSGTDGGMLMNIDKIVQD